MVKEKMVIGLSLVCVAFVGGVLAQRFLRLTDKVVEALQSPGCCEQELTNDELFDIIGKEEKVS